MLVGQLLYIIQLDEAIHPLLVIVSRPRCARTLPKEVLKLDYVTIKFYLYNALPFQVFFCLSELLFEGIIFDLYKSPDITNIVGLTELLFQRIHVLLY